MFIQLLNTLAFISGGISRSINVLIPFIAEGLSLNLKQSGSIKTLFSLIKLIFALPVGWIGHKIQSKILILTAIFLLAIGLLFASFAQNYFGLMIFLTITGIGFGISSPVIKSELAHYTNGSNSGTLFSNLSSSGEIGGLIVSTIIGFACAYIGWRLSIVSLSFIAIVLLPLIWIISKKNTIEDIETTNQNKPVSSKELFINKKFVLALICSLFDNIASNSVIVFVPFLILYFKYEPIYIPIINGAVLIGAVIGKFWFGRFSDKYSSGMVFAICEILMGLLAVIMSLNLGIWIMLFSAVLLGIGTKGTTPIYQSMVTESVTKDKLKKAFSLEALFNNLGGIISPLLFGFIGDEYGLPIVFIGFGVTAIFAAVPALMYSRNSS